MSTFFVRNLGIVASAFTPLVAPPTTFTDNFNRSNNTNISTGAPYPWTEVIGDSEIFANAIRPVANLTDCRGRMEQDATSTDHYVQIKVGDANAGTAQEVSFGAIARYASAADSGYMFAWDGTNISSGTYYIIKITAGVEATLGSAAGAIATNDVLRFECVGTSLVGKKNGTTVVSVTDGTWTTPVRGGWAVYRQSTTGGASAVIDDYEIGNM